MSETEKDEYFVLNKYLNISSEENEERVNNVLELVRNPFNLLFKGKEQGIRGGKKILLINILFILFNIAAFTYGIYSVLMSEMSISSFLQIPLIATVGLIAIIVSLILSYRYLSIEVQRVIVKNLTHVFYIMLTPVAEKYIAIMNSNNHTSKAELNKYFNSSSLIKHTPSIPEVITKSINKILGKLPFIGMLYNLRSHAITGNKDDFIKILMTQINKLTDAMFAQNTTSWAYWLLPINILITIWILF